MTIREKLKAIQTELKAPKNLYNKFGNYSYRNAEGICEAVKPFLEKYNVTLVIWDEVIEVCGRIYVKAYAKIMDCESSKNPTDATATEDYITATAYARECESKNYSCSMIQRTLIRKNIRHRASPGASQHPSLNPRRAYQVPYMTAL